MVCSATGAAGGGAGSTMRSTGACPAGVGGGAMGDPFPGTGPRDSGAGVATASIGGGTTTAGGGGIASIRGCGSGASPTPLRPPRGIFDRVLPRFAIAGIMLWPMRF